MNTNKHQFVLAGLIFTITILSFNYTKAQEQKYFKRLSYYSSLHDPVTPEIAKTIPHYIATYDGKKVTSIEYVTKDNSLQNDKYGISYVKFNYNDQNSLIEETFYDKDNTLVNNPTMKTQPAIIKFKRDEKGNVIEEAHYNKDKELTQYGMAVSRFKFKNGRKIETATYDNNEKLKENFEGFAILRDQYDDKGRLLEESYFDKNEQPKERVGGYCKVVYTYDDADKTRQRTYYKKDGSVLKTTKN